MKLTMKLLLSLGLSLIFGMQAFAGDEPSLTIKNINCPSFFHIRGCVGVGCTTFYYYDSTVPSGTPSAPLPLRLGEVTVCPVANFLPGIIGCGTKDVKRNANYTLTFQKGTLGFCLPK